MWTETDEIFEEIDLDAFAESIQEIDLDLDEFPAYLQEMENSRILEEEMKAKQDELCASMKEAIACRNYRSAFSYAGRLRKITFSGYKNEIDRCIEICADNGVVKALISMAKKYTAGDPSRISPQAFPYLKKLSDMGYINSFPLIAECYYQGIGCERDIEKACVHFFEGMLFAENVHCAHMCYKLSEGKIKHPLLKAIINELRYEDRNLPSEYLCRIAEMILDGELKGYAEKAAYVVLKKWSKWTDIPSVRLGECLLYGLGTEQNCILALEVLRQGIDELEYVLRDPFENGEEMNYTFHYYSDYVSAYEKAKAMTKEAKSYIKEYDNTAFMAQYKANPDIEIMYEEWQAKKELFIERSSITNVYES